MRKAFSICILVLLAAAQAFATYVVVLKNGTRYRAKEKWTVSNGKALIVQENGGVLQLDPSLIDVQATNEVNKLGLGDVRVIAQESPQSAPAEREQSSLGSVTKLRKLPKQTPNAKPAPSQPATASRPTSSTESSGNGVANDVLSKFLQAYENIGLYDANVTSSQPGTLRVEVTTDTEDKVFKAISATSYMLVHVPQSTPTQLSMVELFMKTLSGGAAGKFQMTAADAKSIDAKQVTIPHYYVDHVIY